MRIHQPDITHQSGRHVLSADIELETGGVNCPGKLWFAIEGGESSFLSGMADAFVVGLLAAAMRLGEDVWVAGEVSTRLAHGLDTFQGILNTWWPESFRRVGIHYEGLADRRHDARPTGVGCTFSGGVDSFHAVLQMLPSNTSYEGFGITHALMINGFDQLADLENRGVARQMFNTYRSALADWNVELVMIHTNLNLFRHTILNRADQVHSYSGSLAANAHALGDRFGRFGICGHGNYTYEQMRPYGSHVALDHHLSSDQLQIMHAGTSHSRAEKIELLAGSAPVQRNLRVCFHPPRFDRRTGLPVNCCECEKCVRTMIGLDIVGKLDQFQTFAYRRRPLSAYHDPAILSEIYAEALDDLVLLAERHDRRDWVASLNASREKQREREAAARH